MAFLSVIFVLMLVFTGCSSTPYNPSSYDRQNAASQEGLKSLDHE